MILIFSEFFGFNPWFVHFAWVFISLFPFRKKKKDAVKKLSTFRDPIQKKSPIPLRWVFQISSSTRTIRVAWKTPVFFGKINQVKKTGTLQ